jgi:hypothetical protein
MLRTVRRAPYAASIRSLRAQFHGSTATLMHHDTRKAMRRSRLHAHETLPSIKMSPSFEPEQRSVRLTAENKNFTKI